MSAPPGDAEALRRLATSALAAGDAARAFEHLSAAAALQPADPDLQALLGQVACRCGRVAEATAALERACALYEAWSAAHPSQAAPIHRRLVSILVQLGLLHGHRGDWTTAAARVRRAETQCRALGDERQALECANFAADTEMVAKIVASLGDARGTATAGLRDDWERDAAAAIAPAVGHRPAPLTAVFFHVDAGAKHPFLGAEAAIDYAGTLAAACQSARRATPGIRIVVLTDRDTAVETLGADCVARLPIDTDLMMHTRMRSYRAAIMSGALTGPTVFLDTDVCLRRDFSPLFDGAFDVAWTYRQFLENAYMPLNEGVILTDLRHRDAAARSFSRCLALYDWIAGQGAATRRYGFDVRRWRGGQLAIAASVGWKVPPRAAETEVIDGVRCRFLPCDLYNFPVKAKHTPDVLAGRWALHFKGAHAKDAMQRLLA